MNQASINFGNMIRSLTTTLFTSHTGIGFSSVRLTFAGGQGQLKGKKIKPKFLKKPKGNIDREFELDLGNPAIDYISYKILTTNTFDKVKITSARRNNYLFWTFYKSLNCGRGNNYIF